MKKTDFFYTRVIQTIEEEGLIDPGDKILVGVSGGADSMALLHCLILFSRDNPIHPGVAHLNHMLRGKESDRDADFTEKITNKAGLPFYGKKTDVAKYQSEHGLSTEDAARKVRYAFFRQIAEKNGYNKIATAHHADDNAELILMNLVRGTGLSGLTGIPAKRLLDENAAHGIEIIRPLINHLKTEITQWLESEKIGFITDSSNFDDSFFRNRIRKSVMPFLYERSGQKTSEIINRTGKILKGENQWLADISEELFQKAIAEKSDSKVSLNIAIFNTFPLVAKRRVLRLAVASVKKDLRRISFFHSELIIEMLEKNADKNFRLDLPSRILVLKDKNTISISREMVPLRELCLTRKTQSDFFYLHRVLPDKPSTLEIQETNTWLEFSVIQPCRTNFHPRRAYLDFDKMSELLIIRNFLPGDRFYPYGLQGSQKLKKFFTNNKVSSILRQVCPLIISNGEIAWVGGHRISEKFKIDDQTSKILKIELFLA